MRADAQQVWVPLVTSGVAVGRDEGGGVIGHDWLALRFLCWKRCCFDLGCIRVGESNTACVRI